MLVTNVVQRAINSRIRVPDALVPIYTPFLLTFSLSPSRLMSVMDPLLNMGILWRCLAAYCGIDFKSEVEAYRAYLGIEDTLSAFTATTKSKLNSPQSTSNSIINNSENYYNSNKQNDGSLLTDACHNEDVRVISYNNNNMTDLEQAAGLAMIVSQPSSEDEHAARILREKERLLHYHSIMGDSIFLIETLRNHSLPQNEYMSPLKSSDSLLAKFPKTCLIVSFLLFLSFC